MPSRTYLRRKYSSRSIRRKLRVKKIEKITYYAAAVLVLVAVVFVLRGCFSNTAKKINIPVENVAAFKIPHRTLAELKSLSDKYGVDFAWAVCLYSVENDFFPAKTDAPADIEQEFMRNYERIHKSYRDKDLEPYYNLLNALLSEIKYFPVPLGFGSDGASYMYGDSWDAKTNRTADIIDRENIRGRIPVCSMTAGIVTELGWKEKTGYQIVIKTTQGTSYTYSWLDSFTDGLAVGSVIQPGATLGHMGSVGTSPVRLRLSIAPQFPQEKDFYINPYPFLRLIEDEKAEYSAS